jgi:hypothetical protein
MSFLLIGTVPRLKFCKTTTIATLSKYAKGLSTDMKTATSSNGRANIFYEGPFASLTLRLKRISISTAFLSLTGIPLVILYKAWFSPESTIMDVQDTLGAVDLLNTSVSSNTASFHVSKHVIVGGTGILVGTGSTAALSYCFSPYVHTLEYIDTNSPSSSSARRQVKATTRNILARPVITVFDIYQDVIPLSVIRSSKDAQSMFRAPFCNFIANGVNMYVHPELIHDPILRSTLFGEKEENHSKDVKDVTIEGNVHPLKTQENKLKKDDDDFF